jgi:hypothetical protein
VFFQSTGKGDGDLGYLGLPLQKDQNVFVWGREGRFDVLDTEMSSLLLPPLPLLTLETCLFCVLCIHLGATPAYPPFIAHLVDDPVLDCTDRLRGEYAVTSVRQSG